MAGAPSRRKHRAAHAQVKASVNIKNFEEDWRNIGRLSCVCHRAK
jgi:hypothetical protein